METGSYIDLEIAELEWKDVTVNHGSTLKVIATQPTGRRVSGKNHSERRGGNQQ